MADEKDKIPSQFIAAAGKKPDAPETPASKAVHEYLDALLKSAGSAGNKPETDLNAAIKALAERGKPIETHELLSNLLELLDPKAAAQKKAAETGLVDNAVANQWFADHFPSPRICGVCNREDSYALVPSLGHVSLGPMGAQLRIRTSPLVMLVCRFCGNTLFFNAVMMGVLKQEQE